MKEKSGNLQTWVTFAKDDLEGLQVLVLCRSLRRVFTTRNVVVLITGNVGPQMRMLLEQEFDMVTKIDEEDAVSDKIPLDIYAKIYMWKMTIFTKCVYMCTDSLVLENCDELFNFDENFSCLESSVIVAKPSYETYKSILCAIVGKKIGDSANIGGNFVTLDFVPVISDSDNSSWLTTNVKAARLVGKQPWLAAEMHEPRNNDFKFMQQNRGLAHYQVLCKQWLTIFTEDVARKINNNFSLPKGLEKYFGSKSESSASTTKISKEYSHQLNDSVAVIGLGCRFPGADSPHEFWDLLSNGKDAVREVPFGRWDMKDVDIDEDNLRKTKAGFLKCAIDEFDAKFFGISPREAGYMDPQQRLLLEVAWESLESAGIDPLTLKGSKTGCYIGIWTGDYEALLRKHTTGSQAHRVYLGNAYSATSARVSFFLGLNGPNIATESGCSSSFVSLHLACESLLKGECNLTLAGGVNLLLHPYSLVGSEKPYFMAGDGHCKTFDAKADGFGRAEGCGVVVLKRFADAQRDGDNILGVIRGTAINSEGTTASFGTPSKPCQEIVVQEALLNAQVDPLRVSYVEAHGTGTMVGDPIEISALAESYSEGRTEPLIISSVKTNIGHAEGAAGVAGLIKVLLAMKNEIIPPHRNFETLNPDIPLDRIPGVIPLEARPWKRINGESRMAAVSSFGISGTNVHVIVEEAPILSKKTKLAARDTNERNHHILTLSAKNEKALSDLVEKYQKYFSDNNSNSADLSDVCYTANTGRAHFSNRLAVVGKDCEQLKSNLDKKLFVSGKISSPKSPVAFLFTGQGSQYPGMAKKLYESNPIFRNALDECETILNEFAGLSILNAIWNVDGAEEEISLDQTIYSQTSIFCIEYGLLTLWKSFGVKPDFVLGHSVGEFAAAVAAGTMNLEEALKLVSTRSRLIQNISPGGMLALKTNPDKVRGLIETFANNNKGHWLDVAVVNSNDEVVVAGRHLALEIFAELCSSHGIKTVRVAATQAFHSRDMEDILESFGKVANTIKYKSPQCGYVSGRDGKILVQEDLSAKYWQNHARDTVNFPLGLKTLHDSGCRVFIEVGPHPILLALALNNLTAEEAQECSWLPSIRKNEEEWVTMLSSLGKLYVRGVGIDWKKFDDPYSRSKVELPTYPFQRQKYWFQSTTVANSLNCNTKLLHPLLGKNVPVATNDLHVNVYQHSILLANVPYLADHQVANKVIMPGAGFFEMILSAGHLTMQGSHDTFSDPKNSFVVQDFTIEAPLELLEDKYCQLQTVVCPSSGENVETLKISVYRKTENSNQEWKRHASAIFNTSSKGIPPSYNKVVDIDEIRKRCTTNMSTEEMYKKVAQVGISFGPTFQSIKQFLKGQNEILAQVEYPECGSVGGKREYICHPIVLDAILQAYAFQVDLDEIALYLPVAIEKFTWLSKKHSSTVFLHLVWDENSETKSRKGFVKLLNDSGNVLGIMEGVRLVKTTVAAFVNFLNVQKREVPDLFEHVFRPRTGPLMSRMDLGSLPTIETALVDISDVHKKILDKSAILHKKYDFMDPVCYLYFVNTLYELGWCPSMGEVFQSRDLMTTLLISYRHTKYVERILSILEEEHHLEKFVNPMKRLVRWKVIKTFPPHSEVKERIAQLLKEGSEAATDGQSVETPIIKRCGDHLTSILQEKESALSILFPEDNPSNSAFRIYTDSDYCAVTNEMLQAVCEKVFSKVVAKEKGAGGVVRILEVGAGSGSTTQYIIEAFNRINIPVSYTFTDISPTLVSHAAEKFKDVSRMTFKTLNIENDPKSQGFAPNHYDLVIAANVIHATTIVEDSLKNILHLLAPKGYLLIFEMFKPIRHIDLIFGILDGFWRFKDLALRPNHPLMSAEKWKGAAKSAGFKESLVLNTWKDYTGVLLSQAGDLCINYDEKLTVPDSTWLVFGDERKFTENIQRKFARDGKRVINVTQYHKFQQKSSKEISVNPLCKEDFGNLFAYLKENRLNVEGVVYLWSLDAEEEHQEIICAGLLHFSQFLMKAGFKILPRIFIVSRGVYYTADEEPTNPTAGILRGFVLTMKSEQLGLKCCCLDLDPNETNEDLCTDELYDELWTNDSEAQVALRQRKRFVVRLVPLDQPPAPMIIPNSERYKLVLPTSKAIADLVIGTATRTPELEENQLEISVKASGLNFRDLLVIMRPAQYDSLYWDVGMEFSGTVVSVGAKVQKYRVGDDVFGFTTTGAVASHTVVTEAMVMRKPAFITHAEAATMPITVSTAYHSLIEVAKMTAEDTVLIHVASGGVGIAAIQICKQIGSKIIATAGSHRKRAYLRSLGISHIFHSRNTSYGDDILKATNGLGVDIVLNSLTGPNFKETSLRICKPNARFVEMSKINIWKPEEVEKLRPDVKYTIVNLEYELDSVDRAERVEMFINSGIYKPLPCTTFDVTQTKEAFAYFQRAHHIGKIVITMPQIEYSKGMLTVNEMIFNSESTYLVTGGLGGIGLEVAKFITRSGGNHVILVGRSAPNATAEEVIKMLTSKGVRVITRQVDVGDFEQCKALLGFLKEPEQGLPPLRGIMHAAGFLSDGMIENQDMSKFNAVFNAKVKGAWNLHNLTKEYNLEHFVLYSSAAAVLGPLGQSNHAAANSFLDTFAHYRHALGLPIQTINWGIWSEIGAAAELALGKEGGFGIRPFSPTSGLAALRVALKNHYLQVLVTEVDMNQFKQDVLGLGSLIEEIAANSGNVISAELVAEGEKIWKEIKESSPENRTEIIKVQIESMIRQTLKLPEDEPLDEHQSFSDMGLDSLMAVEMRNKLQLIFGKNLTLNTTALLDNPNIHDLSNYLTQQIAAQEDSSVVAPKSADFEKSDTVLQDLSLEDLVKNDSVLSENLKGNSKNVTTPSKMRKIFLTGATGQLGIFVLAQLALKPEIQIYCLIRSKSDLDARKRLVQKLKKNDLFSHNIDNVVCVSGNITDKRLGLSMSQYNDLAENIDGVIHCAVKANHIEEYVVAKGSNLHDLRSVNVLGTKNILEFSTASKTKQLLHVSSLVAVTQFTEDGGISEELSSEGDLGESIKWGYALSKFVGEKLMRQAIERNVPIKVLRFPTIVGDSKTGKYTPESNHLMLFMLSCMHLRKAPKMNGAWSSFPVDVASRVLIELFFKDNIEYGAYNINNPGVFDQDILAEITREKGYDVQVVSEKEWTEALMSKGEDSILFPLKDLYLKNNGLSSFLSSSPVAEEIFKEGSWGKIFQISDKLKNAYPDIQNIIPTARDMYRVHLDYSEMAGYFNMFSLKRN